MGTYYTGGGRKSNLEEPMKRRMAEWPNISKPHRPNRLNVDDESYDAPDTILDGRSSESQSKHVLYVHLVGLKISKKWKSSDWFLTS